MGFDHIHQPDTECPLYREHIVPYSGRQVLILEKMGLRPHNELLALPKEEGGMIIPTLVPVAEVMGYIIDHEYRLDQAGNPVSSVERVPSKDRRTLSQALRDARLVVNISLEGRIQFL